MIYCSIIGFDEIKYLNVCVFYIDRIYAATNGYL